MPDGFRFNFNQYLIDDDAPLLFHTGPRRMFPLVREAVGRLIAVERLRYVGFSHFEADECGALNEWLSSAPQAEPVCGRIAAMVSTNDVADRAARALATRKRSFSAATPYAGSTRRTRRTGGTAG
jgi:flavorubredoxin